MIFVCYKTSVESIHDKKIVCHNRNKEIPTGSNGQEVLGSIKPAKWVPNACYSQLPAKISTYIIN